MNILEIIQNLFGSVEGIAGGLFSSVFNYFNNTAQLFSAANVIFKVLPDPVVTALIVAVGFTALFVIFKVLSLLNPISKLKR